MSDAEYSEEYGGLAASNTLDKRENEDTSQSLTFEMLVTAMSPVQNCNHFAEPAANQPWGVIL